VTPGKAIGKSGDGGIDGIIKEDKLGLDVVYVQAKRWDNNRVGRPECHAVCGRTPGAESKQGNLHHNLSVYRRRQRIRQPKSEARLS